MPEQQQGVDAEQQQPSTVLVKAKSTVMPGKTTKDPKGRHHRKKRSKHVRHNKSVAMQILAQKVPYNDDNTTVISPQAEVTAQQPVAETPISEPESENVPSFSLETILETPETPSAQPAIDDSPTIFDSEETVAEAPLADASPHNIESIVPSKPEQTIEIFAHDNDYEASSSAETIVEEQESSTDYRDDDYTISDEGETELHGDTQPSSNEIVPDPEEELIAEQNDDMLYTISETAEQHSSHVVVAVIPLETDPAIPVIATKVAVSAKPVMFVPATPPVEMDDEELSSSTWGLRRTRSSRPSLRTLLTCALVAVLLASSLLLWQDLSAMHLLVSTVNANNGTVTSQQELASYHDDIRLTAPLALQNSSTSAEVGVYSQDTQGGNGTQQVLTLQGNATHLSLQQSASLANGAITQASNGRLLVESANGLQVMTSDGHVLWQIQGTQPTRGVHAFAPVSDAQNVYAVASLTHSQVGAYDLNSGHVRWTVNLPDTLAYAPPLLLNGGNDDTLYVASDSNLFALDTFNGNIRWQEPIAARTLLMVNSTQGSLLLALGPQGVQALQSTTGELVWAFRGDPNVSTISTVNTVPTQFYQGTIDTTAGSDDSTLYATGVVWHMATVREDMLLYAIDIHTGTMRWSQQIAADSASVDAERLLQPYLDTTNSTVIVQRGAQNGTTAITSYDEQTGKQRWNTLLPYGHMSAPNILQISPQAYVVFSIATSKKQLLHLFSPFRIAMLLLMVACACALFVLLLLSLADGSIKVRRIAASTKGPHRLGGKQGDRKGLPSMSGSQGVGETLAVSLRFDQQLLSHIGRRWRKKYTRPALIILGSGASMLLVIFLLLSAQAQHRQTLATDAQGSIVTTDVGNKLHQLQALNSDGSERWSLFSSEGTFSVPAEQTQGGMVLVALHGDTAHTYSVASDDPAYTRPLDGMLALYLLDRDTGRIEWQHIVSYPGEQQQTSVVGLDSHYIYVVGEQILNNTNSPNNIASTAQANPQPTRVLQLFAVSRASGAVDWRVFGPEEPASQQVSFGTVHTENELLMWHTGNTLFTIDTGLGQIIERTASGK